MPPLKNIAIIGAGMSAIACARTLVQAGHKVSVFEKTATIGGRMASQSSAFGSFDHGAQYFTVRDPRFARALQVTPQTCKPWSANTVQVLDEHGRVAAAALPPREPHWVAAPDMGSLLQAWAQPLLDLHYVEMRTRVTRIEPDVLNHAHWQIRTAGPDDSSHVYSGFDAVVLAIPAPQASLLLQSLPEAAQWLPALGKIQLAPCWTIMLAYPQAVQPGLTTLGPQWNAARSTHHRVAWLARESSKPARGGVERWTVQASAAWSREHVNDDALRVQAKLVRAFAEITGIRAEPAYAQTHRWLFAQTEQALGRSYLWSAGHGIGLCGDWCLGHRVENAFVSGLELALAMA
jgi:predicted NAD/FAD-dependent oxidoreductase